MTQEQVLSIMQTQVSRDQRLNAADDFIASERTLDEIKLEVRRLHDKYVKLSADAKTNNTQCL